MSNRKILTVPGLFNSGPGHWQTHWEKKLPNLERIHQRDYDNAVCSEWVATIQNAVAPLETMSSWWATVAARSRLHTGERSTSWG